MGEGRSALGSELEAIRAVARDYLDGMVYADEARLRSAFHPLAAVVGFNRCRLERDTVDAFVAAVLRDGGPPPGTPYFAEIVAIDVTGDIAMVKLVDDYLGSRFTDYLTMLKHEGGWVIVHKAYYERPRDEYVGNR